MAKKDAPPIGAHLVAGVLAGAASTTATHPLDLIKVRYQVHASRNLAYRSLLDAFTTIAREEGVRGLYSGLWPALLGNCVSWGGYFLFYEQAKRRRKGGSQRKLGHLDHLGAAVEASTTMVLLTNPLWLIKTRMETQGRYGTTPAGKGQEGVRQYRGVVDAARTIVKEEGLLGLYKGVGPALILVSHGAIQFVMYEWMKDKYKAETSLHFLLIGGLSKMVASILTYPYQVVKSRLQNQRHRVDGSGEIQAKYKGMLHCFQKMLREEGLRAFFKGCFPNAVRVAPASAINLLTYESIVALLSGCFTSSDMRT